MAQTNKYLNKMYCLGYARQPARCADLMNKPSGGTFLARFGLLFRCGQGEANWLCIPAGCGLRAPQLLPECHDGSLGGHLGRATSTGRTLADDKWLRLGELTHCPKKVVEYDAAAPRRCAARRAGHDAAPRLLQPLPRPRRHHSGCGSRRVSARGPVRGHGRDRPGPRRLLGLQAGWGCRTVARRSRAAGQSHVVRYDRLSTLGAVTADSLHDAASHGRGDGGTGPGRRVWPGRERTITMVDTHETVASTRLDNSHDAAPYSLCRVRLSQSGPAARCLPVILVAAYAANLSDLPAPLSSPAVRRAGQLIRRPPAGPRPKLQIPS